MALEAGVPVIPVRHGRTVRDRSLPGGCCPKIKRVGIRIGRPLDFSRYEGMEDSPQVLRSVTDEIMYELMVASGQEYVDHYASKAKEDLKAARAEDEAAAAALDEQSQGQLIPHPG